MSPPTETLAQVNRKYWDTASSTCHRAQWVTDLQTQIGTFLSSPSSSTWLGLPPPSSQSKMLDYACGDGLPSRVLKPHFKTCIGIDVSAGMLATYNASAARLGLGPEEMLGVRGDLLADTLEPTDPPLADEQLRDFDLVVICMALHHVADMQGAMDKLAERVRPGGTLLVIDWATMNGATAAQREFLRDAAGKKEGEGHGQQHHFIDPEKPGEPHPASHTITRDSFREEEIDEVFRKAGCTEVRWKLADELSDVPGARSGKMQLFWARGTKADGK